MEIGEHLAELVAQRCPQGCRVRVDDGYVVAVAARGRGGLHPDPPGADDQHAAARPSILQCSAQYVGVFDVAQVVQPAKVGPWQTAGR